MHTLSDIDSLLPRADLVIGCLPNTKETGHILNYDRLCLMKSDALFINVGRGSLVDTDALIRALEEFRLIKEETKKLKELETIGYFFKEVELDYFCFIR